MIRINDRSTQTILQQQTTCVSKRQREELGKPRGTPPKRTKSIRLEETTDPTPTIVGKNMRKGSESTTGVVMNPDDEVPGTGVEVSREPNDWVLKTKRRRKPPRPDAMIIKTTEQLSFADMLRKVRNAPELKSVGEDVHLGEILPEFRRSAEATAETHHSKLKTISSDDIEFRTITQETTFELRYLDEVTTED